jgi:hypothetical protein
VAEPGPNKAAVQTAMAGNQLTLKLVPGGLLEVKEVQYKVAIQGPDGETILQAVRRKSPFALTVTIDPGSSYEILVTATDASGKVVLDQTLRSRKADIDLLGVDGGDRPAPPRERPHEPGGEPEPAP